MNKLGHGVYMIPVKLFDANSTECIEVLNKCEVIIIERNYKAITLAIAQDWRVKGKFVLGVFDDAYHLMEKSNKAYAYWIQGLMKPVDDKGQRLKNDSGQEITIDISHPHPMKLFRLTLETFHGYHTPSKILTNDFIDCNTNGRFIPNYLDSEMYLKADKKPHTGIIIGWGGSMSHFKSFTDSGIINSLKRVFRNRKDLTLMVCGDKEVFDLFPVENKIFMPYVSYDNWPNVLANFDIGLAPLSGNRIQNNFYDQRRSWIKVGEFLTMGIPWIASDIGTYDDYRQYGNLVENESKLWDQALYNTIDNYKTEKEKVMDVGKPFALGMDIYKNAQNILMTYKEIAEKNGFKVTM